ncbi:MAG: hypothetical protein AAB263_10130, partial [Planctomycetota bacterium]
MPPSPSTVPGIRIWPNPSITHWPAIAIEGETRNVAFSIPVKQPGAKAELGWEGDKPIELTLPKDAERASGLMDLALKPGVRKLRIALADVDQRLPIRVVDAIGVWPLARLIDGYPVDAAGVPVVLLDHQRPAGGERTWAMLKDELPRPSGRALIVGDPLAAMGATAWDGLDADTRPATDLIKPHHACLVALAKLPDPLPRSIIWCPGNGAIRHGEPDPEEVRLIAVLRTRFEAMGVRPILFLALPPLPVEAHLQTANQRRREDLIAEADRCGWKCLDLAHAAGPADAANRVGNQAFTTYPLGQAQARMRELLAMALGK